MAGKHTLTITACRLLRLAGCLLWSGAKPPTPSHSVSLSKRLSPRPRAPLPLVLLMGITRLSLSCSLRHSASLSLSPLALALSVIFRSPCFARHPRSVPSYRPHGKFLWLLFLYRIRRRLLVVFHAFLTRVKSENVLSLWTFYLFFC